MQGGNIRAAINVDLNLGDALGEINKLKSGLKQLKIPANATKGFENSLDSLVAEMQKFDSLNKNIKPGDKTGMNALEKSYQNILKLAQKVDAEMASMGSKGKSLISDSDLAKMNKLNDAMKEQKQLQSQIADKKKAISQQEQKQKEKESKFTDKINKNQALAQDRNKKANKILNDSKTVKEYVKALEEQSKAEKRLKDAKNAGSDQEKEQAKKQLEEANKRLEAAEKKKNQYDKKDKYSEYKQLKAEEARALKDVRSAQTGLDKEQMSGGEINKIIQNIEKLKGELKSLESSASLDKIRAEFASLAGVPVENVTTDIEQLNSEIKSLQTNKIEQLKASLDQLGNSSGINKLNQDLRQGQQQLNQYRGEFDKLTMKQRDADDMKYRLTNFFSWSEGLNLIKRGAREAFQAVKDLDDAMTGTAVVTDFSVSDLWDMLPKYTDTANKLGATVQGAYETMTLYYQQGLDTEAAFGMGTETMKMSRIADMDYVEGTDLMTAAIRGFHMDLTETSAKWVNDVYSELAAISASDTHEIATAMTKTASIADSANAEFDTTAAFLTQMIETTREAPETAGTALKTIIARFQELKKSPDEISDVDGEAVDANKIEAALRTIDVDLRDTTGQFRDFDDVILEISDKWDSLDTNTQRYIATVAAGARQQSRFIALVADNERLTELVEGAQNSAGASDKQFEKTMESLTAKLNTLKNAYHEFLMGILDSNIIKGGVDALTGLFNILNNLADLTGPLGGLVKVLMAVGMFMGGRSLVLNGISTMAAAASGALATGAAAAAGSGVAGAAAAGATARQAAKQTGKQALGQSAKNMFAATMSGQLFGGIVSNAMAADPLGRMGQFSSALIGKNAPGSAKQIANMKAAKLNNAIALGANGMGVITPGLLAQAEIANYEAALLSGMSNEGADRKYKELHGNKDFKEQKKALRQQQNQEIKEKNLKKYKGKKGKAAIGSFFDIRANNLAQKGFGKTAGVVSKLGGAMAALGPIGLGVGVAISAVAGAFAIANHVQEKNAEKAQKIVENYENAKQTFKENSKALKDMSSEYKTLSKGVDKNGKNISLSAEQYERYKEVAEEIATIDPSLVKEVDIHGNIVLEDNAIEKALRSQEENMEFERMAFGSESNLKTMIKGSKKNIKEVKKQYSDATSELSNFGATNVLGIAKGPAQNYQKSTDDLVELYDNRYDALKTAKERLDEIARTSGVDSRLYDSALEDYKQLQGLIGQGKQLREAMLAEKQPIVESLKNYAAIETDAFLSLNDQVADANQGLFSRAIEDTAMTEGLSASEMQNRVDTQAELLSTNNETGKEIASYFDQMEAAKANFDTSLRDSDAVEEYNQAIADSSEGLEELITELENSGDADKIALAETLRAEFSEIQSYAQETKMTISEAFNGLQRDIESANKAYENYQSEIASGDYYTGRQSFGQIYEDITSALNLAGEGSQSFWSGAEMLLSDSFLNAAENAQQVKNAVKSLGPLMQDGASGANAFVRKIASLDGGVLGSLGITKENGVLDWSNFDTSNIDKLADALGLSKDLTTALLNNARQFNSIEFSNVEALAGAMADSGLGRSFINEEGQEQIVVSWSALKNESGMNILEFNDWLDGQNKIVTINYEQIGIEELAEQYSEIYGNDSPFVYNTDQEVVGMDFNRFMAAAVNEGHTVEEATTFLQKALDEGITISNLDEGIPLETAVSDKHSELTAIQDPLIAASDSMQNAATAMSNLVALMGGGTTNEQKATSDSLLGDSKGTKGVTLDSLNGTTASENSNYLDDLITGQNLHQGAADNAATDEIKAEEQGYADKYDSAIANATARENAFNVLDAGGVLSVEGKKTVYDPFTGTYINEGERADKFIQSSETNSTVYKDNVGKVQSLEGIENYDFANADAGILNDLLNSDDIEAKWNEVKGKLERNKPKITPDFETNTLGVDFSKVSESARTKISNNLDNLGEEEGKKFAEKFGTEASDVSSWFKNGDFDQISEFFEGLDTEQQIEFLTDFVGMSPEDIVNTISEITGKEYALVFDDNGTLVGITEAVGTLEGATTCTLNEDGTLVSNLGQAVEDYSTLADKSITITCNYVTTGEKPPAAKGMNRPAINYGSVAKGHLFGSAAKGHSEGIIGPRGGGGMTLTGELGPELVWEPDRNVSYMVGVGGPEVVPLPGNAVVYPANMTKNIVNGNRSHPQFGSTWQGTMTYWQEESSKALSSLTSGAKAEQASSKKKDDVWENEFDWLYNLTEDINELLREREEIEKRYDLILEKRNASISDLIELTKLQLRNLENERDLQQEMLEKRKQEMTEYIAANSDLQKYATYNWEDQTIEIDWDKINSVTNKDEGEKIEKYIKELEEMQESMDEAEESLLDIEEQIQELKERGKDEYFDLEERVIDALEQIAQNEIDRISEISDAISDSQSKLLDSIQKSIDEERQKRDNQKTEDNLGDMRRRLAYLRQDTSGMNALEIKQLEEQLKEEEEAYGDTLVDQKLQEMQDQNDEASAQRERQITIMEEQLKYNKESGVFAQQARDAIVEARDQILIGVPIDQTSLYTIISEGENWQSESWAQQLELGYELNELVKQVSAYLGLREETNYMAEINELFKVLGDPNATSDEKADAKFRIAQLEKERDKKIIEEGRPEDTTNGSLAAMANANYLSSMSSSLESGDREALAQAEQDRNRKLVMMGKGDEQTNFLGAYDRAQAIIDTIGKPDSTFDPNSDYGTLMNEALKKGDFETALYYELLRDAKIANDTKLSSKYSPTKGSLTWEAMKNWTPPQQQTTQQQQVSPNAGTVSGISTTLQSGSRGEEVKKLQTALKALGHDPKGIDGIFGNNTLAALKAFQKAMGISQTGKLDSATKEAFKTKGYLRGGLADYTGPAWLDGTPSKPELVLNARDTENFIQLKDILADLRGFKGKASQADRVGDTYYDVQINVDKISNDYDVEKMAEKIKKIIHKDSMYRNVNAINFLR